MSQEGKYILNRETLRYEFREVSRHRFVATMAVILSAFALFVLYLWLFTHVDGLELPKTTILKRKNAVWASRMEVMNTRLDNYEAILDGLQDRDDHIYRPIFGMSSIPESFRESGFGGVNRYSWMEGLERGSVLRGTALRLDTLVKRAYVQSHSYDDVEGMALRAGEMASCIPAIPPLNTDPSTYRMSSPFGYRSDPLNGSGKLHTGMDFACPPGNPVHVSGDGVVELIEHKADGYGNSVMVNHGFGYRTRYAHMDEITVEEGQKLLRGDYIGTTGHSGRVTGPHLHYEVLFGKDFVDPAMYMDLSLSPKEYASLVKTASETTGK